MDILDELEEIRSRESAAEVVDTQRMVRITLHPDNSLPQIEVKWNPGRGGQKFRKMLHRGESMIWPLDKAMAEFGPFGILEEYKACNEESRKGKLRDFWVEEKRRALDRFDYPRASLKDRTPTAPHRFPDLIMTIIDADGNEFEPIRLHSIYKIGEWDPLKETFGNQETVEQAKERYAAELDQVKAEYDAKSESLAREVSELKGLLKGLIAAGAVKEPVAEVAESTEAVPA